jgi:hypothetical protein
MSKQAVVVVRVHGTHGKSSFGGVRRRSKTKFEDTLRRTDRGVPHPGTCLFITPCALRKPRLHDRGEKKKTTRLSSP